VAQADYRWAPQGKGVERGQSEAGLGCTVAGGRFNFGHRGASRSPCGRPTQAHRELLLTPALHAEQYERAAKQKHRRRFRRRLNKGVAE